MPQIRIIRAALREIQKLACLDCEIVYEILRSLSQETDTDTVKLRQYNNLGLFRTKKNKVRVIWKKEDNNIVIIKAASRDDAYENDLKDRDFENQESIIDTELYQELELELQGKEVCEQPAYKWSQENPDWYEFVFNNYRYSPVITSYQKEFMDTVFNSFNIYRYSESNQKLNNQACVIQSAPGTGKTLCATLFACEVNLQQEWNIILIVPKRLRQDIAEYSTVKQVLNKNNFWLVTFEELLTRLNPELTNNLALPEEELAALKAVVNQVHLNLCDISYRDVLLYQSFVLDKENQNQRRNAVYQENQNRINDLEEIKYQKWLEKLNGKKSRIDAVKELRNNIPALPFDNPYTLVIVDEAQDLMLCEVQTLITACREWNREQNFTNLWLLGDLNQRIQPTDFNWKQLHLGETKTLERNYRNSRHILEFANQFRDLAENINKKFRGQHLPLPTTSENAFEEGEKVRVLKCDSRDDALVFLQQLALECESGENKRYLLHNLANSIKVITNKKLDIDNDNLIILNAEDAKGREFEACVACGLFTGDNEPSLEEAFQWYTLLTRARSRLLILLTSQELNRLNNCDRVFFDNCLEIDFRPAISWITELASDVDVSKISNVKQRLLKRCDTGHLYWDTYSALQLAGIEGDELYQWEQDAISRLKKHGNDDLKSELNNIQNISLRCLLWRAMGFSWQAVIEATSLETKDSKEYERLINSIAQDLEIKGLIYEAARIKARFGEDKTHLTFPFWQEISENSNSSQPLITLLCEAFASRIENIFKQEDIKQ